MSINGIRNIPQLNVIVAVCENMGIGHGGNLPWRLKNEMKYFNDKTTFSELSDKKNAVIMGRKTWFSIPKKFRPLKDRINVVLTRNSSTMEGANYVTDSFEKAVEWLTSPSVYDTVNKIFVIGGESVYKHAIESEYPVRVYITKIMKSFECDTFFPELPQEKFVLAKEQDVPRGIQTEDGVSYKIEVLEKRAEKSEI